MAVGGSLSMFIPPIPRLCPIASSSSPRSTSSAKHLLPTICSALREVETWRNERASSVSPWARSWREGVSTALAAAVFVFGCPLPANAGIIGPGAPIGSVGQLASAELRSDFMEDGLANIKDNPFTVAGSEKPYFTKRHLLELADMQGSLYEKDHRANLDALGVSPEATMSFDASILQRSIETIGHSRVAVDSISGLVIADIDPSTAKLAVTILGPSLSAFGFLFIARIVMSWYPKLPVDEFPYVLAYAPTEPLLTLTRKVIPPLGGVDVTPVVWFGIISFLNEILDGPQGLLVLLSQQVS
ncbi:hypothetical protein MLD38_019670 [Melastoma candidum]|uniref:Uncharacterized protein n=1 Tax=Melastoma candidum TaxID=119954 RepID=A0ACB9R1T2_9MYRT|nr:hypothetical protein MLD38_019670 [Melastoma candidum]